MQFSNDVDARSLQQILAGQPSALLDLYDRHAPLIFAQAYASLGDRTAAEDVVQETFTAAWFEVKSWANAPRSAIDWLLELSRERLQARSAPGWAAPAPSIADAAVSLPRALRDRVLDSIYGAGERLRPPYAAPQWAKRLGGSWAAWLLLVAALLLTIWLA
jgi:DNA-directed RNA polymerase specialized sigma24 family protein